MSKVDKVMNNYENIAPEKFVLVQSDAKIKDVKFDTKPIGYFKDAFMRFRKNKSSVTAAIIIIFLLLFAIFGPIISRHEITEIEGIYKYVPPKSSALSFIGLDGTKVSKGQTQLVYDKYNGVGVEVNSTADNADYSPLKKVKKEYVDTVLNNGKKEEIQYYDLDMDSYLKIGFIYQNLTPIEYFRLQSYQNQANIQVLFPLAQYHNATSDANVWYRVIDSEYSKLIEYTTRPDQHKKAVGTAIYEDGKYIPDYLASQNEHQANYYSLKIDGDDGNYLFKKASYKNNNVVITNIEDTWYTYAASNQTGYKTRILYNEYYRFSKTEWSFAEGYDENSVNEAISKAKTENDYNDIMEMFEFDLDSGFYPEFIFGMNEEGKDIFTLLSSGARLSFILAICVSAINLTIGAFYGAVEGYYGGAADMIMERISDVLSGVPFIVVATLFKLHLAEKLGPLVSLLFAFVLTGWIGMAARVRMQFYRFKGQEYVLSSRTLGAKDFRIMFKHIFPNAIGTIITGSILSIPGVIFSESMLSYLGIIDLSTSGFTSVGTLLSVDKNTVQTAPHILAFPAIFISLLMISFNLFGNGLRDAFNPSLRGADE